MCAHHPGAGGKARAAVPLITSVIYRARVDTINTRESAFTKKIDFRHFKGAYSCIVKKPAVRIFY
jgi:hypothetical protein